MLGKDETNHSCFVEVRKILHTYRKQINIVPVFVCIIMGKIVFNVCQQIPLKRCSNVYWKHFFLYHTCSTTLICLKCILSPHLGKSCHNKCIAVGKRQRQKGRRRKGKVCRLHSHPCQVPVAFHSITISR